MQELRAPGLKLYDAGDAGEGPSLFEAEILRPIPRGHDVGPPGSLEWFLEAEKLRYQKQGHWIASMLEFARHSGERVLGVGGGLGTDWVQFAINGAEVTAACPGHEELRLVRANFALRKVKARCELAPPDRLPVPAASMDVVCLQGLPDDPFPAIEEAYRVLKPGGKVLCLAPAYRWVDRWLGWLPGHKPVLASTGLLARSVKGYGKRGLASLFHRFIEPRVSRRHMRRSDVPAVLRFLPTAWLERLAGRIVIYRGFKPLSAALSTLAAA
jgi:ubiquinone/menaquinone biosynthesis C-methylase UbiE